VKYGIFSVSVLLIFNQVFCSAIIGGRDNNSTTAYIALVSSSGVTTPLSGPFAPVGNGQVFSVAINSANVAIVGGRDNGLTTPYVVFVSPSGVTSALSGPALPVGNGMIRAVSINNVGAAIIGGRENVNNPYVALVSSSGVTSTLSGALPSGLGSIDSVSINDSGAAIIGGEDNGFNTPYTAVVSSSGVATALSGPAAPVGNGLIFSVAINNSGAAIIGGRDNGDTTPYAVLVSSSGVRTALSGPATPVGLGQIRGVAINNAGAAIIGGSDNAGVYAALVSPSGMTTALSGPASPVGAGGIRGVAINNAGAAIIGGEDNGNTTPYAVLVSPSGVRTALSGPALPVGDGMIISVAINDAGAAIIGGEDNGNTTPYAALVSPSGITTALSGTALPVDDGFIFDVALANLLDDVVPSSFGPGSSFANSLFALSSQILSNHLSFQRRMWDKTKVNLNRETGLLTDASDVIYENDPQRKQFNYSKPQYSKKKNYSIWGAPFGDYAHQKSEGSIPAINNWIAGFLLAFDYHGIRNTVIGCGAAYAYNYADLSEGVGHSKTNQEFLTLYGSWMRKHFYINLALWGGLYQMKNERHSIAGITSKSNVDGWLLLPHLEISTPFYAKGDWFLIDPFAMFDWANNWQGHVNEKGPSGFNLNIGHQYTSLLRSEAGLRFFESLTYGWGTFVLMEKASWVNKKPFHAGATQTSFISSVSSFSIEIFSNNTQNLGAVQFGMWFIPSNNPFYGSINYHGEFGSSFQNHLISLEFGGDF